MTSYVTMPVADSTLETHRASLLKNTPRQREADQSARAFQTKNPGNATIAIRDNGRVCAIAGWDGR